MAIQIPATEFDTFLRQHPDGLFELIHREIIEKMPTEEQGVLAAPLITELTLFTRQIGRGRVMTDVRYWADPFNDRLPDIALTFDTARPVVTEGAVTQFPDLIVEIKSPDDTYLGLREKAAFYLKQGVRMVWLVFPEKKLVENYQSEQDVQILTLEEALTGDDVLPGFTLSLKTLFA
ncbi:MAG: Uma2 family endonuclease [Anaerolineae bacterium]